MINLARKIIGLLTPKEQRRGALLLCMVVVMAALETVGIASVTPFLAVLGNPEVVSSNPILYALYQKTGTQSISSFLMILGLIAFAVIIFAAVFRIATLYAMHRFVQMRRHSIGERLLETYLRQPYSFFLSRHSADMAKTILSEVDTLILIVFRPAFNVIAYACVAIAIVVLLMAINPWLALVAGGLVGGLYAAIFIAVKGALGRTGRDRELANKQRFTAASEAISGIKDIKLLGRERAYLSRFRPASIRFARHWATNETLSQVPKYFIEAVGVGAVLGLALYLMNVGDGVGEVLPVLGLYAFAGYKLLPAAQQIYAGISNLKFGAAAVYAIDRDLSELRGLAEPDTEGSERLVPEKDIALHDIDFIYPGSTRPAISNISFSIPVGASIGLVGGTGAGKTTLVDVILGLLQPTSGFVSIDDTPISKSNIRSWQRSLGYVPQHIFLADASIAENIALGVPAADLSMEKVRQCAAMAQIDRFIETELPEGYGTVVGESGVRLSGGQRQRIGIARALYHDPQVLVFDEATSALDSVTERFVMEAITTLAKKKTMIFITHRFSTVRNCDWILLLEGGRVRDQGSFEDLLNRDERFRALANAR